MYYFIQGNTGEWEDRYEWAVSNPEELLFVNRETAVEYCDKLNTIGGEYGCDEEDMDSVEEELRKLDTLARVDYNGVYYIVKEKSIRIVE